MLVKIDTCIQLSNKIIEYLKGCYIGPIYHLSLWGSAKVDLETRVFASKCVFVK